jgi:hypothetical protein
LYGLVVEVASIVPEGQLYAPIAITTPMGIKDLGNTLFSALIRVGFTTGFSPVVINAFSHLGDE